MIFPLCILSGITWQGVELTSTPVIGFILLCAIGIALVLWRSGRDDRRERRAAVRENRLAKHQCIHCGYNLVGNVSGVCPECGEPAGDSTPSSTGKRFRPRLIQQMPADRRLFRWPAVVSLGLCLVAGFLYLVTIRLSMDRKFTFETIAWLGWTFVSCGAITVVLLLMRAAEIRVADERVRRGVCPVCGYDLRATTGKCPECGAEES
jgi:predicted RNA-binding Zn-ribbon protein involved in translation (DUF1610 family)